MTASNDRLAIDLLGLSGLTFDHFARERADRYLEQLRSVRDPGESA